MGHHKHSPMKTQCPRFVLWDCGTKQISYRGRRSTLIPFVMTCIQPCRYCLLWIQRSPYGFKTRHLVKRSLYIYSAKNFLPYSMWDITNTLSCKHNVLVVSHGIAGPNKWTPKQTPHRGRGSVLIPFVTTCIQPCRYCPFWTQRDPHCFKTRLFG